MHTITNIYIAPRMNSSPCQVDNLQEQLVHEKSDPARERVVLLEAQVKAMQDRLSKVGGRLATTTTSNWYSRDHYVVDHHQ